MLQNFKLLFELLSTIIYYLIMERLTTENRKCIYLMSTLLLFKVVIKKIIANGNALKSLNPYPQAVQFSRLVRFSGN